MLKSNCCWWTSLTVEIGFLTQRQALALSDKSKDTTCKSHSPSVCPVSIYKPWRSGILMTGPVAKNKSSPLSYHLLFIMVSEKLCFWQEKSRQTVIAAEYTCWHGVCVCMSGKIAGTQVLLQQEAGWRMVPSFHIVVTGLMVPSFWYCCNRLVQTWASLPPGISSLTDVIQNIFSTWLLAMALPSTSDFCASQSTRWTDCCQKKVLSYILHAGTSPKNTFCFVKHHVMSNLMTVWN